MPDAAKAELLRALGRLVRGLSMLFWGLPACMIADVETARSDWLEFLGNWAFIPATVLHGLLLCAFAHLRHFQKQERIWTGALNRAEGFALVCTGLAPFLFWWRRFPLVSPYSLCVSALFFSVLLLLMGTNRVLQRLAAMLPDEALRGETNLFTSFDISLLVIVFIGVAAFAALEQFQTIPYVALRLMIILEAQGIWFVFFLCLLPLAMTLAMIWKIKETIFASIINAER